MSAVVVAVNISEKKGTIKHEVPAITLIPGHGIEGDAHAGNWHRQVSLLAEESIDSMRAAGLMLGHGVFAENISTRGIDLWTMPVGTRLRIGKALLEITQIGKECHNDCEIKKQVGRCVMPTHGVFAVVLAGGIVCAGDSVAVWEDKT